jgi:hypothetical protein
VFKISHEVSDAGHMKPYENINAPLKQSLEATFEIDGSTTGNCYIKYHDEDLGDVYL